MNDLSAAKSDVAVCGGCKDPVTQERSDAFSASCDENPVPMLVMSSSSSPMYVEIPTATKPAVTSFSPYKILYPVKCTSEPEEDPVKWLGLTPLAMVQHVTLLAGEKSPERSSELRLSSLCNLRLRSREAHDGRRQSDEERMDDLAQDLIARHGSTTPLGGPDTWNFTPGQLREFWPEAGNSLSNLEHVLDADPQKKWCLPSYQRVQQACLAQFSANSVKRAASQLQALVEMVTTEEPEIKHSKRPNLKHLLAAEKQVTCQGNTDGLVQSACQSSAGATEHAIVKEMDSVLQLNNSLFQSTMSTWLKQNFVNPYPDQVMLKRLSTRITVEVPCVAFSKDELAVLDGGSLSERRQNMINLGQKVTAKKVEIWLIEKINNWLVNIRTRKVRSQNQMTNPHE